MTDPAPVLPVISVTPDGNLAITVGDNTIHPRHKAWMVICPRRVFLRGFDNPDSANQYAQQERACLVAASVAADHTPRTVGRR